MKVKKFFKTNFSIDEQLLGIIEDSIYYNPQLTRDDKDALVTSLYELFYETGERLNVYEVPNLEKPYVVPLADEADRLIPELLVKARE